MRNRLRVPRGGREGFTLIEVLIAMVILAVGLLGLQAMSIGAARMVAKADRHSEFTTMATSELETALNQFRQTGTVTTSTRPVGKATITRTPSAITTATVDAITVASVAVQVTVSPATGHNHLNFQPVTVVGRANRIQ